MENLTTLWNFINTSFISPVGNAIGSLWNDVLVPAGTSFIEWIQTSIPACVDFADFCTSVFQLRYQGRIYSFMMMLPIIVIVALCSLFIKRRKRHEARRKIK